MNRQLFSLPAFLASFVLAALAIGLPASASAQVPVHSCNLDFSLDAHFDCPNEFCSLSFPYVVIRKPNCAGCCLHGTASLVCDTGTVNSSVHLCANCGGSASMDFYCPSDPLYVAETLYVFCKTCP